MAILWGKWTVAWKCWLNQYLVLTSWSCNVGFWNKSFVIATFASSWDEINFYLLIFLSRPVLALVLETISVRTGLDKNIQKQKFLSSHEAARVAIPKLLFQKPTLQLQLNLVWLDQYFAKSFGIFAANIKFEFWKLDARIVFFLLWQLFM